MVSDKLSLPYPNDAGIIHKFPIHKKSIQSYDCTLFPMVVPGRIELPTQGFSVLCSTDWATGPLVAREGFEPTTSGLWARRATRLLYLATRYFLRKAEELGFEPRRRLPDLPVFKTGPFNHLGIPPYKWTLKDSNLRPVGYEPTALTNWAKGPSLRFSQKLW